MAQPYYGFTTTTTLDDTALMLWRNLGENKNISFSAFKSLLFTAPTITGNLNFTGTGNRITGDFSNTTLANRVMFQTSTVNGNTTVHVVPNGTSTAATFQAHNRSDPDNSSKLKAGLNSTTCYVGSEADGTGTLLPLSMRMVTTDHLLLSTNGNIVVKTAAAQGDDDGVNKLQVTGNSKITGNLTVTGTTTLGAYINTGAGVSTGPAGLELGQSRTGDGISLIDFHSKAGTDYEARVIRYGGTDGAFQILSQGTGGIYLTHGGGSVLGLPYVASSINYLQINSSTAGNPVALYAAGEDANINLRLVPKGTGVVEVTGGIESDTLKLTGLPVYADNTAALAGGLVAGNTYRTSTGVMMVVF